MSPFNAMADFQEGTGIDTQFPMLLKSRVILLVIDGMLFSICYYLCHFAWRGSSASLPFPTLPWVFYLSWLISGLVSRKFNPLSWLTWQEGIRTCFKSSAYLLYAVSFVLVTVTPASYSKLQVFSTSLFFFVLETLCWSIVCWSVGRETPAAAPTETLRPARIRKHLPLSVITIDFLLLAAAFPTASLIEKGFPFRLDVNERLLLFVVGLWFLFSLFTNKFSLGTFPRFAFAFWQWFKTGILMAATVSVAVFVLDLFYESRLLVFTAVSVFIGYEILFLIFYYTGKSADASAPDVETADEARKTFSEKTYPMEADLAELRQRFLAPARDALRRRLMKNDSALFSFMDKHINLQDILCMETASESGAGLTLITLDKMPVRLFMNLEKLNDIRRLNRYFLDAHQMLVPGGYFVGVAHTIETHNDWIFSRYPERIAQIVFLGDFFFHRIIPKLPWFKGLYFAFTKGRGRIISKAEVLGRLCFCGFEIVAETEINKRLCVIARKIKPPSTDPNPTYGPLVELKRAGINNTLISIYKFRTMHPYSEYLQQYVYDRNGLRPGGKIDRDFRVTAWGRVLRNLFLDELPMLYNWIKGDLQLVGVRPLSLHYFGLYDSELRRLRQEVRPGLIPPFYADLPETLEEIRDSERRYINAFLERPLRTQWTYFRKAVINILLRGSRSK